MTVMGVLRPLLLLLALGVIAYTFFSLARGGDERRQLVLAKTALHTVIVSAVLLALATVRNLVETASQWTASPFTLLVLLASGFAMELFFWNRRYGG